MIPYASPYISAEDRRAVLSVLETTSLTRGAVTESLESAICEVTGRMHAVALSSGTAALYCAYRARFAPGSEVDMPANTFVATASAAILAGLLVQVVDVLYRGSWYRAVDGRSLLVIVDYGWRTDVTRGLGVVVRDSSHAFGSRQPSHARVECYSFHAIKNVTAGEGGAIATDDEDVYYEVLKLRDGGRHVTKPVPSLNFHMSEMAAALCLSQIGDLERREARKQEIAKRYQEVCGVQIGDHAHLYPVPTERLAADVRVDFMKRDIDTRSLYKPLPWVLPELRYYKSECAQAWHWYEHHVCIPYWYGLTDEQVEHVAKALKEIEL